MPLTPRAFAKGTLKNLVAQWRVYEGFCKFLSVKREICVSRAYLICYIQYLSEKMRIPQTVRNYVNGLKVWHLLEERDVIVFGKYEIKLML